MKESGQFYFKDEQGNECQEIINQISRPFPGEVFMQDLKLIGDSVVRLLNRNYFKSLITAFITKLSLFQQNLNDLFKGIVQNEIKLTIEMHPDETISILQDNMDDSNAYYSLCSDHENASHFGGESFLPTD